jgi:hypothetical protein
MADSGVVFRPIISAVCDVELSSADVLQRDEDAVCRREGAVEKPG